VEYIPEVRAADDSYPLILLTGTTPPHLGTGTRSSRSWRLAKFSPQALVEIGRFDAQKFAIADGDTVSVISPVGRVTTEAKISDTLPKGMLFMPTSYPKAPVNGLFDIDLDPETKTPSFKACTVRIEKVD
jgi:formate dehydrogenase major subunit